MTSGETRLVGLIGKPVAASLSPRMQNAAFAARGLDWAYVPLPVEPDELEDALRGLLALGFAGANVTAPYKLDVALQGFEALDVIGTLGPEGIQRTFVGAGRVDATGNT